MRSADVVARECRWCHRRQLVRVDTDGDGHLVEGPLPCGCAERRAAGLCIDCGAPVDGKTGRALRCAPHRREAASIANHRWRKTHAEQHARTQAEQNAKRRTPEERARRREYERALRAKPEHRARRRERRRRLAVRNPHRNAAEKRRYRERYPERVKEQQTRANAKRAAAKREYMHLYATRYVGEGKQPRCRTCRAEVPWNGRGRPRLDCPSCRGDVAQERVA